VELITTEWSSSFVFAITNTLVYVAVVLA